MYVVSQTRLLPRNKIFVFAICVDDSLFLFPIRLEDFSSRAFNRYLISRTAVHRYSSLRLPVGRRTHSRDLISDAAAPSPILSISARVVLKRRRKPPTCSSLTNCSQIRCHVTWRLVSSTYINIWM